MLPFELQNHIQIIANIPIIQIQSVWRRKSDCMNFACKIRDEGIKDYEQAHHLPAVCDLHLGCGLLDLDAMVETTSIKIGYCLKHGCLHKSWWLWEQFIEAIEYGLFNDEYTGGPGAVYYNKTEIAKEDFEVKFKSVLMSKKEQRPPIPLGSVPIRYLPH